MEKIGVVVGETRTNEFLISMPKDTEMMENEYVVVEVNERGKKREVVGRITSMGALSSLLTNEASYDALEKIINSEIDSPKVSAFVETLGYLENGKVKFPRNPPFPGTDVYRAPNELLEEFYRVGKLPLRIGNLLTRDDVAINLNPRGFMRHMAIIAQTGGGKSYTAGVLMEELYEKGASLVVIDPHADYVRMKMGQDGKIALPRFTVFRNPMSTGRYEGIETKTLSISLEELEPEEISNILGIPSKASKIRGIIANAMDVANAASELSEGVGNVGFDDLYTIIEKWAKGEEKAPEGYKKENAMDALRYLKRAKRSGIANVFSNSTTPLDEIVKSKHIAVLDLSGLKNEVQEIFARIFLMKIYDSNTKGENIKPVFILVEEAHNFIPKNKNPISKEVIKKIAAEGRKFGVFLVIITQRPQKVDQDVLSQMNSYIILRLVNKEDIKALTTAAEGLSEDLSTLLPSLNPGEAVVVGPVVNMPGIVKIRERKTQEGGGDIDIITKLEEANEEAENEGKSDAKTIQEIRDLMEE